MIRFIASPYLIATYSSECLHPISAAGATARISALLSAVSAGGPRPGQFNAAETTDVADPGTSQIRIANWSSGSSGSSSSDGDSGDGKQKAATVLMDLPAGRWLVMIAGIGIVGFGGYEFYKHVVNTEFMGKIESADEKSTNTIETIGRIGYGGRSALMIGIGIFFFVAGLQHHSDEVKGLSGLLGELAGNPWGQVALWVIAIGTFAYGAYTLIEAKYRRAHWSARGRRECSSRRSRSSTSNASSRPITYWQDDSSTRTVAVRGAAKTLPPVQPRPHRAPRSSTVWPGSAPRREMAQFG